MMTDKNMRCEKSNGPKVLVIGLDGATFSFIDPLIQAGRLPNLAMLKRRGVWGRLISVTPPQTPVAWASFRTGVNPGKHGIFGWWKLHVVGPDPPTLVPYTRADIRGRSLWKIISDHGMSVGVVNVPMTFPPEKVKGFIVAGFDNHFKRPEFEASIAYPEGLTDEIRRAVGDYRIIESFNPSRWSHFSELLASWRSMEATRTSAVLYLLDRYHPEFLMVVFHITDYFSHREGKDSSLLHEAYECADQQIGRLLEACDQDTTTFVISDHGAQKITHFVFIHNWLEQQGLIKYHDRVADEQVMPLLMQLVSRIGTSVKSERARPSLEFVSRTYRHAPQLFKKLLFPLVKTWFPGCSKSFNNIDWMNTRAFCNSDYGHIYINRCDRSPYGVVKPGADYETVLQTIIEALEGLVDPESGERIVGFARPANDVYRGPLVSSGPDIIITPTKFCYYFIQSYKYYLREQPVVRAIQDVLAQEEHSYYTDHDPYGILIVSGDGIKRNHKVAGARLVDIAPTILAHLGMTIPSEMDGRVVQEIYESPRKYVSEQCVEQPVDMTDLQSESIDRDALARELRRKLRMLGYRV